MERIGLRLLCYIFIFLVVFLWPSLAFPDGSEEISPAEDFDELDLEKLLEIVYSAARHMQDIFESPSAITVITREQIENTYCDDIACLLRQVAEVDVKEVKPLYTLLGCRALTEWNLAARALVLVDGRDITIEFLGFAILQGLPVHLENIERIEIIRGPGSALYGANAHSIVVSITTRKPKENAYRIFMGGGEHDNINLHLSVDRVLGANWTSQVSVAYETSGHWRIKDRREREISRVRLRFDHEAESSNQRFELGLIISDKGAFNTGVAPGEMKDGIIGHATLFHQNSFLKHHSLEAKVTYRFLETDLILDLPLYYKEIKLGEMPKKWDIFTSDLDTEVQFTFQLFKGNLLIAGGNHRWIMSEMEGNDPPTTHQHRVGVFLHDEQKLAEDILLTVGVRFDYNNITPFTISPRAAGTWRFAKDQVLRLSFGMAFRKPNFFNTSLHLTGVKAEPGFEELENLFREGVGNPDVGNEKVTAFEVGYRGRFFKNRLNVEADVFYNLYRDIIAFKTYIPIDNMGFPDLSNGTMEFVNTEGDVDSLGGSVSLTWKIKTLRISANYTFRHSWYVLEPDNGYARKGDRVPWEPAHMLNLSFHYIPKRGLRLGMAMHGRSSADVYLHEDGSIFGERKRVHNPPTFFTSGFLAWRLDIGTGWIEVGVRAYNILNAGFRDSPAVTRPDGTEIGGELLGRQVMGFVRGTI